MTREPSQRSPVTAEARVPHVTSCARIPYAFFMSGLPNRDGKLICPSTSLPPLKSHGELAGGIMSARVSSGLCRLRDVQIELLRYGQTGESLRGRLLAAATAPLAPLMPLDSFPIAIGRRL
jgi:hypothetical protein